MSDTYINDYHRIIGLNVKRLRKEKNLSQLDLAYKIGHKSVSIISCAEINHKNNHLHKYLRPTHEACSYWHLWPF